MVLSSLIFLLVITKRYSAYTFFTASVSNTVFFVLQISHNEKIQLKTQKRRKRTFIDKEAVGPLCSPKRTVCCFGEGKPLYLLTLIYGSTILYGTQSVRQLVTRLVLCSCSGLPVWYGTASTIWVSPLLLSCLFQY